MTDLGVAVVRSRRWTSVALAGILPLLLAVITAALCLQQLIAPPASEGPIKKTVHEQVNDIAAKYRERLHLHIKRALHEAFDTLDANNNGVLDRDEFTSSLLSTLATTQLLHLPEVDFSNLLSRYTIVEIIGKIITCQITFLVLLYVVESLHNVVRPGPRQLRLNVDYVNASPPRASVAEALRYDTPMTTYERVKMVFFVVSGLLFIRILFFVTFVLLGMFTASAAGFNGRTRETHPRWFHVSWLLTLVCSELAGASMGFAHPKVFGSLSSTDECRLLVANHSCVWEIVYSFVGARLPSFVSRVENLAVPLFPGLVRACDAILVDRDKADSRQHTADLILGRSRQPQSSHLIIFPEGTTGNQRVLFLFRKGAFEGGEPIQMVCCTFPYRYFNPCWTGRCCGGNDALDLVLRLASQFVNRAEIAYLPVYHPTEEEKGDPALYASRCQCMMAAVLGASVSDATYADYGRKIRELRSSFTQAKLGASSTDAPFTAEARGGVRRVLGEKEE